jgi:hypothetical protein
MTNTNTNFNQLPDDVFLDLCYPRRTKEEQISIRDALYKAMKGSPRRYIDGYGNMYIFIGSSVEATREVAFTSHLDNVDNNPNTHNLINVNEKGIVSVHEDSQSTCLGADDAAGLFIMLAMINNEVEGTYCFFMDEEVGCKGSQWAAQNMSYLFEHTKLMVSFDRKGYSSIITHQMGENCMSIECATELAERLNEFDTDYPEFILDNGGSYTDSYSFVGMIPNCTNVSVGYFNQHTKKETQDLEFLQQISEVYSLVDWHGLPVGKLETTPSWGSYGGWGDYAASDYDSLDSLEESTNELLELALENPDIADNLRMEIEDLIWRYSEKSIGVDINDPFYFKDY